ncbi:MAG: ion transporter [Rhodospirillales bacterium]|nr:ion transporter [Rhodospirillales bacterium]
MKKDEPRSWPLRCVEHPAFQRTILALIIINAITLGMETSPSIMAAVGPQLIALDRLILAVFVIELGLRIAAYGRRFFRDPWSLFDLFVVMIALMPQAGPLSVLRALRILRALRLISAVPRLRRVVAALLSAIPGMGAIILLMCLIFYVAAVIATKLFGSRFPEWFGTIGESLYSLFQIMTLESWSMGIVRPVLEVYPHAWAFFVPFILIATFTMLNLFIAVIVNAMQSQHNIEVEQAEAAAHEERAVMLDEIRALRRDLDRLLVAMERPPAAASGLAPSASAAETAAPALPQRNES